MTQEGHKEISSGVETKLLAEEEGSVTLKRPENVSTSSTLKRRASTESFAETLKTLGNATETS